MCVHTQQLPYICPHDGCGQAFDFPSALKRHISRHHQGNKSTWCSWLTLLKLANEHKYTCGYEGCSSGFAKYAMLQQHMKGTQQFNLTQLVSILPFIIDDNNQFMYSQHAQKSTLNRLINLSVQNVANRVL